MGYARAWIVNKKWIKNQLIKKLNAKRFLKHIYKKVNDVSALRYAIIKLRSEKVQSVKWIYNIWKNT